MSQPKSYSLRVEIDSEESPDPYWARLTVEQSGPSQYHDSAATITRAIRLDNMYEQVQQIVDNHLRQICNKLSTQMREQRKLAKDK